MALVSKDDRVRQIVDLDPGDRLFTLPVSLKLLDLRVIQGRDLMASHTLLDRGDPRYRRSAGIGVAILTSNLEITCMALVAERNGLYEAGWPEGKGQTDPHP